MQEVVIVFSEIRGFTALSENQSPDRLLALLSEYQRRMTAAIFRNGGTLGKFIGDGIMARFATPDAASDEAECALRAAQDMRAELAALRLFAVEPAQYATS